MTNKLIQLLPEASVVSVEDVMAAAKKAALSPLTVGSEEAKTFCADLSRRLMTDEKARKYPELQALGFWLRPSSIENAIRNHFGTTESLHRSPTGVVLQLPPSNVEALFGYTATLSLLCGNVTIVRLSSSEHPAQLLLAKAMTDSMANASPAFRERLFLLRYDHDDVITDHLSSVCDTRMVWGSNETVDHIRRIALPPLARHISFGDRFSAAALKASSYLEMPELKRDDLIENLFNDMYWFDQMACSSPRLFVWAGSKENVEKAADDFFPRLAAYATERGYQPGTGETLAKLNACFLAFHDLPATSYKVYGPALSVIEIDNLTSFKEFKNIAYGFGLLITVRFDELPDLADYTERRDQTLGLWGFDRVELRALAEKCRGRGFDRLVPIGQALAFAPVWDGINMIDAMTRLIQVEV